MHTVGIVAEYNPLHKGHLRHLELTRRVCPEATVVVCMSGNWVQRGECAITDKWRRARWAAEHGADLVLELPTPYALSSAEGFARGAVSLLAAAGITHLSFGCEDPDLPRLQALAATLDDPGFPAALQPLLAQGLSYPAARQKALETLLDPRTARLVEGPNNNLAVEYLRALSVDIIQIAIPRSGSHDGPIEQEFPSASALRRCIREDDITSATPHLAAPWDGPVYDVTRLELPTLCKLRQMGPEELAALPDGGDGLGQRLWKAAQTARSLAELWEGAKTRRHTLARLRRLTLRALLPGLDQRADYLRVLAMTGRGAEHLAKLKGRCSLPIITKPAQHRELLAAESARTDLFSLCAPTPLPCGEEWRHSPAIL